MPTTNYIWDVETDSYLMETDGSNVTQAVYTNEPVYFGNLVSQRRGSTTNFCHFDATNSSRQLTDTVQSETDHFVYDAFGNERVHTGVTNVPFRWAGAIGYFADIEFGSYYVRIRQYRPQIGRWTSRDTSLFADGINLFGYSHNNPVSSSDPSGRLTITAVEKNLDSVKCGEEAYIRWQFELDKPAPCYGYFVQHIELYCIKKPCAECDGIPELTKEKTEYWEAWYVFKGEKTKHIPQNLPNLPKHWTDESRSTVSSSKCGNILKKGTVKFYCSDVTGSLGNVGGRPNDDDPWSTGQKHGKEPCLVTAGQLPSKKPPPPKWWSDKPVEGPAMRSAQVSWICCDCESLIRASATPSDIKK